MQCFGAEAASLSESNKEQQLKSSVAGAGTETCSIWKDDSDGTYLVWHPNISSAMGTLQLKNILWTQPRGRRARLIRHHEKCHICFLLDLYFILFFSLSTGDWHLEKSLSSSDRRESRSSSYLCHHSYWSEPQWKWANNAKQYQARANEMKVIKSPVLDSGLEDTDDWEQSLRHHLAVT